MPALIILRALLSRVRLPYLAILLLACTLLQTAYAQSFTISTVAGNGNYGYNGDGVAATTANLGSPFSVAVDPAGNLYLSDSTNNRVRKVSASTGLISTVAGNNGYSDYSGDGGLAVDAGVGYPQGIALDSAGNLYIASTRGSNRIRKVSASTGLITTVAGGGSFSSTLGDGGLATNATLSVPAGIALDSAGNLYIADSWNNRIRKVTLSTGIITTVAGNGVSGFSGDGGPATSASLNYPQSVAIDSAGNLTLVDSGNNRIRKVTLSTSLITTVAGNDVGGFSGDGGLATNASFRFFAGGSPEGVNFDSSDNLYISDTRNDRIRKIVAGTGIITTVAGGGSAGLGDSGPAIGANLSNPSGSAFDRTVNLYFADSWHYRIRKLTTDTPTSSRYSKIANNGAVLPDSAALGSGASAWACTRDNTTGLIWEVKTADGGLRDRNTNYTSSQSA